MNLPEFLSKDDYLQNPIMKWFIKDHELDNVLTRDVKGLVLKVIKLA